MSPCLEAAGGRVANVEPGVIPPAARQQALDPFAMRLASGSGGRVLFLPLADGPAARALKDQFAETFGEKRRTFSWGRMVVLFDDKRNQDITELVFRCVKSELPKS